MVTAEFSGENILPNVRMQHPGTITLRVELLSMRSSKDNFSPPKKENSDWKNRWLCLKM